MHNTLRAAASGLALGCLGPACSDPPTAFDPLRSDLASFQQLDAALAWADPTTGARSIVELQATPDTVRLEVVQGMGGTVTWSAERGVRIGEELMVPLPSLNDEASDLYGELRDGLDDTELKLVDAPSRAPLPDPPGVTWADLELPFDWARQVDVALGVDTAGTPTHLVLQAKEPPLAITAQAPRGGPRTVTLSENGRLWLIVESWVVAR